MNLYILITYTVRVIGGTQMVAYGKCKHFDDLGWKTAVLYYDPNLKPKCSIPYMQKYDKYNSKVFAYTPADFSKRQLNMIFKNIMEIIGQGFYEKVYIESHYDIAALWGEFLAKELNGIHLFYTANETYRGLDKFYNKYIDFFWFKYNRKEIIGSRASLLFEGYHKVKDDYINADSQEFSMNANECVESEPIWDIDSKQVAAITQSDYNIAYIGRCEKPYVPEIIKNVVTFSERHYGNTISFIIVGNSDSIKSLLSQINGYNNIRVFEMGDMVPIPKSLYEKVDVVIAGSDCAIFSYYEGKPVITVNAGNYLSNGVMGYTCEYDEFLYTRSKRKQISICEELDNVLITKEYKKYKVDMPKMVSSEEIYNIQDTFFKSDYKKEYYPVEKYKSLFPSNMKLDREYLNCNIDIKWLREFIDCKESKVCLFGTGKMADVGYNFVINNTNAEYCFVDNDKNKIGSLYNGHTILSPYILQEDNSRFDAVIINSTKYWKEIRQQVLLTSNIPENRIIPIGYIMNSNILTSNGINFFDVIAN